MADLIRWMQEHPLWGIYICGGVLMLALHVYDGWWHWGTTVDEWHSRGPLGKLLGLFIMFVVNPTTFGPLWPIAAGASLYNHIKSVRSDIREEKEKEKAEKQPNVM